MAFLAIRLAEKVVARAGLQPQTLDCQLILDLQDGEKELFNLKDDPHEKNNISSSEPRITYEMEQALRSWLDRSRTNPQDYMGVKQNPIDIF